MSGAFRTMKAAKRCQTGRNGIVGAASRWSRRANSAARVHALALGEVDQDQVDVGIGAHPRRAEPVGLVLALGERRRLAVGGDFGQGIDGRAARLIVGRRDVGMDRNEQIGAQPPRDRVAVLKRDIACRRTG